MFIGGEFFEEELSEEALGTALSPANVHFSRVAKRSSDVAISQHRGQLQRISCARGARLCCMQRLRRQNVSLTNW